VKLKPREVERLLAGELRFPVVLFYGPDQGLVMERSRRWIRSRLGEAGEEWGLVQLDGERVAAEPGLLLEAAQGLSLWGGRRAVRVRHALDRITPALKALLARGEPAAAVALEAGDLGPQSTLRRFAEAAERVASCPCYRLEGAELQQRIRELIAEHGLAVDQETLAVLAAHLGADAAVTRREVEKLALYIGDRPDRRVRIGDVEAVVAEASAASLDAVVEPFLDGSPERLMAGVERMLETGHNAVALVRQLQAAMVRLVELRSRVDGGLAPREAVRRARPPIFFRQQPAYVRALSRWSRRRLLETLAELQALELALKQTGAPQNVLLRQRLLELAGAPER